MPCAIEFDEDGSPHFWCGPGVTPCAECGRWAEFLCDFPTGRGTTCDAPLCDRHAIFQGMRPCQKLRVLIDEMPANEEEEDTPIHFCPVHHVMAGTGGRYGAGRLTRREGFQTGLSPSS